MLPGFIVPPEGLGTFEAGDQSTVSIPENGYPFAVGTMQTGSEEIKEKGLKGKGVKVGEREKIAFVVGLLCSSIVFDCLLTVTCFRKGAASFPGCSLGDGKQIHSECRLPAGPHLPGSREVRWGC